MVVGVSFMAHGEASSFKNRAHRPGGDGESSPGGGRGILHGPWGGIILQEPGTPALGGRGVQPRWWSGYPSWPMGRHHPSRTGHTGLGGTGSPAQVVVGVSFTAHGEASSVKNRATGGRATTLRRVPCPGTPRPVAMHHASARAGAPHIPHVFPPGPSLPAHLDACHEDPALEPPRFRARVLAFTRPAADAGPWRRAARALPACERGVGRRRGRGGYRSGEAAMQHGSGRPTHSSFRSIIRQGPGTSVSEHWTRLPGRHSCKAEPWF